MDVWPKIGFDLLLNTGASFFAPREMTFGYAFNQKVFRSPVA
ncbi:hypothetical protein [Hymenobacter translucens]|nr:hypothetical protein [Hymenobacter translucens]